MINIEIEPLKGINIENVGVVLLGEKQEQVERILGKPNKSQEPNRCFYDKYELRIDYGSERTIEFIEFIYGPYYQNVMLTIYGVSPFTVGANNLVELLTKENRGDIDYSEAEYSYAFLDISVGIWRSFTQTNCEQDIIAARISGEYEKYKSLLEEDLEKAKNFWTIGIGIIGYYR